MSPRSSAAAAPRSASVRARRRSPPASSARPVMNQPVCGVEVELLADPGRAGGVRQRLAAATRAGCRPRPGSAARAPGPCPRRARPGQHRQEAGPGLLEPVVVEGEPGGHVRRRGVQERRSAWGRPARPPGPGRPRGRRRQSSAWRPPGWSARGPALAAPPARRAADGPLGGGGGRRGRDSISATRARWSSTIATSRSSSPASASAAVSTSSRTVDAGAGELGQGQPDPHQLGRGRARLEEVAERAVHQLDVVAGGAVSTAVASHSTRSLASSTGARSAARRYSSAASSRAPAAAASRRRARAGGRGRHRAVGRRAPGAAAARPALAATSASSRCSTARSVGRRQLGDHRPQDRGREPDVPVAWATRPASTRGRGPRRRPRSGRSARAGAPSAGGAGRPHQRGPDLARAGPEPVAQHPLDAGRQRGRARPAPRALADRAGQGQGQRRHRRRTRGRRVGDVGCQPVVASRSIMSAASSGGTSRWTSPLTSIARPRPGPRWRPARPAGQPTPRVAQTPTTRRRASCTSSSSRNTGCCCDQVSSSAWKAAPRSERTSSVAGARPGRPAPPRRSDAAGRAASG